MPKLKSLRLLLMAVMLCCLPPVLWAQEAPAPLTLGQPVSGSVAPDAPVSYTYTLNTSSMVTWQVLSETAQPTIRITQDGAIAAEQDNDSSALITSLSAYLNSGTYTVEIGSTNNTSGSFVLVVQSETPVTMTELTPSSLAAGQVSAETRVALYHLTALTEPSTLSITSGLEVGSSTVTLWNETLNTRSGLLGSDLLGGVFNIPANGASYRVEIAYSTLAPVEPFTLCWAAKSSGGCTGDAQPAAEITSAPVDSACTLAPAGSAVNVRSSASTSAPIIASLKGGISAAGVGLSPDGAFYNIEIDGLSGWVAASVVIASGNCGSLPAVVPPAFTPVATQAPTLPPTMMATQPPTATPAPTTTPTASGPCKLTLNSPVKVYVEPIEKVDYLYDQVQSGELIPVGRLADNSWWKTNYANSWVPTYLFGSTLTVSGNCALPVVAP